MKIVIENVKFGYDEGCKLLKLKHETCPYPQLEEICLSKRLLNLRTWNKGELE
jgi:hypothetical protein